MHANPRILASRRQVVFDEGGAVTVTRLGDLRFAWAEDRVRGTPPHAGIVGLLNMGAWLAGELAGEPGKAPVSCHSPLPNLHTLLNTNRAGNTCYLNAVLQCLSVVEPLTAFALEDSFPARIQSDNPAGMGGRMAVAYSQLMRDLWGARENAMCPPPPVPVPPPPPPHAAAAGAAIASPTAGSVGPTVTVPPTITGPGAPESAASVSSTVSTVTGTAMSTGMATTGSSESASSSGAALAAVPASIVTAVGDAPGGLSPRDVLPSPPAGIGHSGCEFVAVAPAFVKGARISDAAGKCTWEQVCR